MTNTHLYEFSKLLNNTSVHIKSHIRPAVTTNCTTNSAIHLPCYSYICSHTWLECQHAVYMSEVV